MGFKVKNFRSFDELQHFSMLAGKVRNNENHIIETNNKKILKFSGLFGANGSGKSNLIIAISIIKGIFNGGIRTLINNQFYRGKNGDPNKDSYFEYEIEIDKKLYSYGFELNFSRNELVSEWLIDMTKPTEKIIFERDLKKKTIGSDIKEKNEYFVTKKTKNYTIRVAFYCLKINFFTKIKNFMKESAKKLTVRKKKDRSFFFRTVIYTDL